MSIIKAKVFCFLFGIIAIFLLAAMCVPAFASTGSQYEQKTVVFWDWAVRHPVIKEILGYTCGTVCAKSGDSYHHANSYQKDNGDGYYDCICSYCGQMFTAYESDLKQSYDNQVQELPATVYGADGSIYVIPPVSVFHWDASSSSWTMINGQVKENNVERISVNLPLIRYERLLRSYHPKTSCVYGIKLEYEISFPCSAELLYSSLTYTSSGGSGSLFLSDLYPYTGGVKAYGEGDIFQALLLSNSLSFLRDGDYIVAGNYIDFYLRDLRLKLTPVSVAGVWGDTTYSPDTRPTVITGGNYGIVGDNGTINKVTNNTSIVNETTNTYYNPATGQTFTITDWSYDYSERSYTVTVEGGDTYTVTYGDENISITENNVVEGDTIVNNYTIYYMVPGSGGDSPDPGPSHTHTWTESSRTDPTCTTSGKVVYTCSDCGQTKTETLPALGHTWQVERIVQTAYDEDGNLIQQGYTIYQCSVCGEQYKDVQGTGPPGGTGAGPEDKEESIWDKIANFFGTVFDGLFGMVEAVLGKVLDALTSLAGMLMDKLTAVVEVVLTVFDELPKLFGGFLDFLGVIFPYIPSEITLLLTFGIIAVVFIGIIKAIRR